MRRMTVLTTLGAAAALLGACSSGNAAGSSDGPAGTRSFAVGAFDAVALEGADNVRVVTGTTASVVANGPADELDRLDIRVDGSTLKVGRKRGMWSIGWHSGPGVTVTVTTPGIKEASIGGSGDMTVDRVRGDAFKGAIGGSGDLDIADIQTANTSLSIAGSGNIRAAGTAADADLSLAGSGDIDVRNLKSQTADISIAGSGNVQAAVSGKAKISLIGSGDVTVKGTRDCSVSKIGSGEARCEP